MPSRERAVYLAYQTDCQPCALREQCLARVGQRRPDSSGECGPPSLASAFGTSASAYPARDNAMGGCSRARASSQVDSPTFSGNMLRCFRCLSRLCLRQNLLLVRPGPCGHAIAGVGKPGSTATPGGDPRKCVSVLPVFPLFSPATRPRRNGNTKEAFFKREHIPLSESGGQGSFVLFPRLYLFFWSRLVGRDSTFVSKPGIQRKSI
jgi:hypothetical protein